MSHGSLRPVRSGLLVLAALISLGAPAAAESTDGTIGVTARLDPADLGPGQEGFLVVETTIENHLHIYAKGEAERTVWRPIPAPGVKYEVPTPEMNWIDFQASPGRIEWSEPILYQDPNFPEIDPFPVWTGERPLTLRIPVRFDATVTPGTPVGVEVDYSACDEMMCYDRVLAQRAVARVGGGDEEGPASEGPKVAGSVGDDAVRIELVVDETAGEAVVVFEPAFGYHLYMPGAMEGLPIEVEPQPDDGITWEAVAWPDQGGEIHERFEARVPFRRAADATRLRIRVSWQACNDVGNCFSPDEGILEASWGKSAPVQPEVPMIDPGEEPGGPAIEVAEGEKKLVLPSEATPFERVYGDDLEQERTDGDWDVVDASNAPVETSDFAKRWRDNAFLALLGVFVFGVLLAFTPCVLPIIPLTISVIGGGAAGKVGRGRLTVMLTAYVLGLSVTYGAAGAVAGSLGKAIDLDAAFRIPWVVWGIAIFFLLLAAGMLGIFELQPPAWMEKIRGGAAQKSGTLLGSFLLGVVAALIASPCTGPFVIAMLTYVATTGNAWLGFLLFFVLGLGMGAVFFAAGSLNMLARPGPWMVWVRYGFGIILFGVALYFLANAGLLPTIPLFAFGFSVALLAWWALARHLVKGEGERVGVARQRGAILAVILILVTGGIAQLTHHEKPPEVASAGDGKGEGWVKLESLDHLKREIARAKELGRPAVVDVWAEWCHNCKLYDAIIESDPYLREKFRNFVRLKIDETDASYDDLRTAVGLPVSGQPRMAFFDEQGRIRKSADIERWFGKDESIAQLKRRIDFLLDE